jgi:hypothetical protein
VIKADITMREEYSVKPIITYLQYPPANQLYPPCGGVT